MTLPLDPKEERNGQGTVRLNVNVVDKQKGTGASTDDPVAILLYEVAAQNRAAFRDLYASTSPKLFGVVIRILGNRSDAEDALQDIFVRVWLRAGLFAAERGRGMTWLIAISRNLAIDRLRGLPPSGIGELAVIEALPASNANVESRMVGEGEARRICVCFQFLDPATAAAVQGAYISGLSYADLAVPSRMIT